MITFTIKGNLVDIFNKEIFECAICIKDGFIESVNKISNSVAAGLPFIQPGFIDSHVHIESSMLIPSEFARLAVVHGTVATVSDPHEIANVCGLEGIEFMIKNGNTVPFKFYFGAPSCVPATVFETAGASLDNEAVEQLLKKNEIRYLSEMMNFPGVLSNDSQVMKKIESARRYGKPVDGHAPGLLGEEAKRYIEAGISTDHECFTKEEAIGKLKYGMKILIREGSAAKNFDALIDLLNDYPAMIMFCSDDKHPDSLVKSHINELCARAAAKGVDVFKILQAACVNPVLHYSLDTGLLRSGDPADFILIKDLKQFEVIQTYINGELVAENGKSLIKKADTKKSEVEKPVNNFNCSLKRPSDFEITKNEYNNNFSVIEALDGQLITNKLNAIPKEKDGFLISEPEKDILKIVVVNRYYDAPVAIAFIKNIGLKKGAIASSVAHDSHNIIAIGVSDENICRAVNLVIENRGGISCTDGTTEMVLALPVAGLMSSEDGYAVAEKYTTIDAMAKSFGATLSSPFMTISFMALLVIPHIKLSDKGLFDGDEFRLLKKL